MTSGNSFINIPNGEGSDWLRLVLHGVLTTWVNLTTYESRNQVDLLKLQVKTNFSNPLGCILDGFRISMSQIGDVDYRRKFWRPQKVKSLRVKSRWITIHEVEHSQHLYLGTIVLVPLCRWRDLGIWDSFLLRFWWSKCLIICLDFFAIGRGAANIC